MQVFIRLIINKLFYKVVVLVLTIFVYIVITRQAFLVIKIRFWNKKEDNSMNNIKNNLV